MPLLNARVDQLLPCCFAEKPPDSYRLSLHFQSLMLDAHNGLRLLCVLVFCLLYCCLYCLPCCLQDNS